MNSSSRYFASRAELIPLQQSDFDGAPRKMVCLTLRGAAIASWETRRAVGPQVRNDSASPIPTTASHIKNDGPAPLSYMKRYDMCLMFSVKQITARPFV